MDTIPVAVSGLVGPWDIDRAVTSLAVSGSSQFRCESAAGRRHPGLTVHMHRPASFGRGSPILIVMHGTKRNAADYRDTWVPLAERRGCLVVCPEFPKPPYTGAMYQKGGIIDRDAAPRARGEWTFGVIERLFDLVRDAAGNSSDGYHLYGHSAGGQFVHRLALFVPDARYVAAVAANSGWYTMPVLATAFPYGLAGSGLAPRELDRALGRRLIVLIGERDTCADDPYLRQSSRARRQGRNRLERGLAFFAAARLEAARRGVRLDWELAIVPGAAHVDAQMAPAAARALFGND